MKTLLLMFAALLATAPRDSLIVHEWGTFTTIAGADGVALDWRPFTEKSDLPGFVYTIDGSTNGVGLRHGPCLKCDLAARVRMETPVMYFYTDQQTDVSVRVQFPAGRITEWYPSARNVSGGWLDWGRFTIVPAMQAGLPFENGSNHYYAARETDAGLVRVCTAKTTEYEKFLFYRGVGSFELPVRARLEGDRLRLEGARVGKVIVFENQGGQIGFTVARAGNTIARPNLSASLESLRSEFAALLVANGLYRKEAEAMLETWRDSWFEEGLRVFYILPRAATDAVLPVEIAPRPTELVRVLVGRAEVITPELEASVLANPQRHSRFAEPVLKQLAKQRR
jgi:hypothetical protein